MKKLILFILFATCMLGSTAQEKVNFTPSFQKANNGKLHVEIPQLKELLHIMLAITPYGRGNDDMFDQNTQYYKDVLKHFKPYENEPIIKTFDSLLNVSAYNYIFITGNAMCYDLSGNILKKNDNYIFTAMGVANAKISTNPVTTYKKEIEAFAKKAQFQKFYREQRNYYASLISDYENGANVNRQWEWLEKNFKTKINSYLILCSPLINGLNYTTSFRDKGFVQILMVLPPLDHNEKMSKQENELFNTRVMFTEIDHNYVGLPTEENKIKIDSLFKNRADWVNEKTDGIYAYPTPVNVFNEYMTFGVFLLYCQENYDKKIYEEIKRSVIQIMGARGFPKMEVFTSSLEEAKIANSNQKIDDLYPNFLEVLNAKMSK
ncbi:DUF4932 domain-containing protein [Mucilaginibacter rigui]|uniref:DUF4932 domain-containing protein n=1 Tax=Mucilaginibacter rigui TaxID=534635 RepID=A0ABR7X3G8_9SPHI|nr:DUF4932 domain-containing protein [Mucilaginibacter rigui]MBD1385051.1 DUF4932 domain-containing protein [Mucilaginibacter rigui]